MILLEKRAHLVLETPLAVVRLLPVDVLQKSPDIGRADGKQRVSTLPRELRDPLLLHPDGRPGLDLGYDPRCRFCRPQPHRKMNMIGNSTHPETLAVQFARCTSQICVKSGANFVVDKRSTLFRAEDDMHQVEAQSLRHRGDYMSGLQPSPVSADTYLGLPAPASKLAGDPVRPRLVCVAPLALSPGVQPTLGLRPRLVCRRTSGPHLLPQPTMSQPEAKQRTDSKRDVTNADSRTTSGPKSPQNQSAKGATTYQPGPKAQAGNRQTHRGLKARHKTNGKYANTVSSASQGAITS